MTTITISNQTYQRLAEQAQQKERSVDTLAEELLKVYIQPTDHPYIVCKPGYRGGKPILHGTNMPVWLIIAMWKGGDTPEEIWQAYPHLPIAAIYDAISYYFDHQEEIERHINENKIEQLLQDTGSVMNKSGVISWSDGDE